MTTLFDLHGKTVIITGASSGLGEQFAHIFCYQKGIVSPGDFARIIMTNFIRKHKLMASWGMNKGRMRYE